MPMSWPDFLRKERHRLIEDTNFLETGTIKITRTEAGVVTDLLPGAIETNYRNIAEIEQLLTDADEDFGDEVEQ